MSLRRRFDVSSASSVTIAHWLARTVCDCVRVWPRAFLLQGIGDRPRWLFAVVLAPALLIPIVGRTQDSSTTAPETTAAPKPDTGQAAPTTEPSPPAAPAPGSVRVPEVVVSAPRPKRVATEVAPRATAVPRRPISAAPRPATSPPPVAAPAASEGAAASETGPGVLPKPPGQTITTVSGERIKDAPAFTVEEFRIHERRPRRRLYQPQLVQYPRLSTRSGPIR
jgi:hypothetical protein